MADPILAAAVRDIGAASLRQVQAGVEAVWRSLDDLTDAAGDQAIAQVVPLVSGAQRLTAQLHASYISQVVQMVVNTPEVAVLLTETPWARSPLIQARRLVGEGQGLDDALGLASRRARQVHTGDVLRARRDATDALGYGVEPYRPIAWSKTPNPNACEWCRLVSTQLYRSGNRLPAHLNDRCGLNAVTPAEAGAYTNASTIFGSGGGYRGRVSGAEVADVQRRVAERAAVNAAAAYDEMTAQAAA